MTPHTPYQRPLTKRKKFSFWIKLCLAILLLAAIGWLIFGGHSSDDEKSGKNGKGKNSGPVPVGAATVKSSDLHIYLNGLGAVTPRNAVTVHSQVEGQLVRILFSEGQMVKKGDLLAEIDPRPLKAQLEQAKGQQMRDQALLQTAKIDHDRYQTLFKQDSIARQQVDTQASLVKQYEGAVQTDQGQVDNAAAQLSYTQITSPINGRVGLRQVDPGNIVHTSDVNGLVVVTELQPADVLYALPEDNIPAIVQHMQKNPSLAVDAWSRDDKIKLDSGTLLAIDNQVDSATGTVKLKAEFPNTGNTLFANQFVNVHMLLETQVNATIMPSAAVQRGTQGTFVYLIKDDQTVALQIVKLGPAEGENISITEGLNVGDKVVVDGGDALKDGAKIDIATLDGKNMAPPPDAQKDKENGEHHRHRDGDKSADKKDDKTDKPSDGAHKEAP